MTQEKKDSSWLQKEVVKLLEDVTREEKIDHQAAAKYAEILFKMLPRGTDKGSLDSDLAARVRQGLREKTNAAGEGKEGNPADSVD